MKIQFVASKGMIVWGPAEDMYVNRLPLIVEVHTRSGTYTFSRSTYHKKDGGEAEPLIFVWAQFDEKLMICFTRSVFI